MRQFAPRPNILRRVGKSTKNILRNYKNRPLLKVRRATMISSSYCISVFTFRRLKHTKFIKK